MGKILLALLVIILGFNFTALQVGWYHALWWLDVVMHMIGGAWVALLFYYLFVERFRILDPSKKLAFLVLGLGFVALIGVFWEFYEFFMDVVVLKAYPHNQEPGHILYDTHTDFVNDFIGGAIALIFLLSRRSKTGDAH